MTYLGGDSMSEWNRLSKGTRVMVGIGFVVMLSYIVYSGLMAQSIMEQRDKAYARIAELENLIKRQDNMLLEQQDTIIKLRATQVSYHAPESYGIEHYASPITLAEGLSIIAEARWSHLMFLNAMQNGATGGIYEYTTEAEERKQVERYDQLRELLKRER